MTTRTSVVPGAAPAGRPRVLYVDDEDDVREVFQAVFEGDFDVSLAATGGAALELMARSPVDVLVSDMRMDPMKGSELLARAYDQHRDVPRILLTGFSDHDDLADAVNLGHVWAYLQKPWDADQLRLTITRAFESRRLELDNRRLVDELKVSNKSLRDDVEVVQRTLVHPRLQVTSPAMAKVLDQVVAVSGTDANVLLYGETGVGKELVAAAIHERSQRKRGRFVAQNLAALPPELLTSELFGHVKGAFTGAQASRRGLFELADGGTLFLDEIGEAPPSLQAMLLRALESREIWPVGGSDPRRVDLRIIAATNRDLLADAQSGGFRLDLYYRLAVAPIQIPPLRNRPEDVRGLGQPMLEAAARRMNRPQPRVVDSAWRALEQHGWPGNVRELSNLMERLVIYHAGHEVDVEELNLPAPGPNSSQMRLGAPAEVPLAAPSSVSLPAAGPASAAGHTSAPWSIVLELPDQGTTFDALEKEILAQVLARADNNQSRAARSLGLSESTLRSRLKRLGLKGGST
ncbi:MAG TPA: sigma-54 dependent transcriptional regulator [Polyangiaceae bacterium]